ncbi:MAG: TRAP transporter substrate-binding protein, partial [Alphaproteobacteria bacterium]
QLHYHHAMPASRTSPIRYRLGLNQPAQSPTAKRMAEMAAAIERDTDGAFQLAVHPESRLGPDPQMFADVQVGKLEFFVSGAGLSEIAPSTALPLLPFAFNDSAAVFAALDGALGHVIREELRQAGLHTLAFMQNGFHHITTSTRAIHTVDDFAGLKIRSPGGAVTADFWKTVGAEAGMVPFSDMYAALKAKQFDGQTDPLGVVQALRLYEVQTYLSLTGHWWSGFTLLAHRATWEALPTDIRQVIADSAEKASRAQRAEIEAFNIAGETALAERGMQVNRADTASIRSKLGEFYARWKAKFDPVTWRALETHADGLG